jgi:hypothetical protein
MRRRKMVVFYEPDTRPDLRHFSNGQRPYGAWNFAIDLTMTVISGGLWLIWVFVREMRGQR